MSLDPSRIDKLKLKIKALMERSVDRGFTPAEADEAMRKAAELMDEYDLTEAEIHQAQRADKKLCVKRKVHLQTKHFPFSIQTCWGITDFLDIKWWEGSWANEAQRAHYAAAVFFGPEADVEIAAYLFELCHNGIEMAWRDAPTHLKGNKAQRQTFYLAAAQRLNARFREMKVQLRPTGTSLVILKNQLVAQEFKDQGIQLKSGRSRNIQGDVSYDAARAGRAAADKINITSGLPGGGSGGKRVSGT